MGDVPYGLHVSIWSSIAVHLPGDEEKLHLKRQDVYIFKMRGLNLASPGLVKDVISNLI